MRHHIILTLITAFIIAGCGGPATVWRGIRHDSRQYAGKHGFTAELPARWMLYEDKEMLLLTRHSVPMDFIRVKRSPLPASLPNTELSINAYMQVYEIAEVVVNSLRASRGVYDLAVLELSPEIIDGREGFSMLLVYNMENGMRRRCLIYGFIHSGPCGAQYYTEIGLYALEDYYFGAVAEDFLSLVGSFRVR